MIDNIPTTHALYYNYPNPFKPITVIDYAIPQPTHVKLVVYDILGRKVATLLSDDIYFEGEHSITWDGKNDYGHSVSSGIYIYQIKTSNYVGSKVMSLLRQRYF